MNHKNTMLCNLLSEIVKSYYSHQFPDHEIIDCSVFEDDFDIDQWSSAGAYFDLKKKNKFKIPNFNVPRLWSSLWFILNGGESSVVVIVYVENGHVTTIELATAGTQMPDLIYAFEVES